jgi:hypothetical protein
MVEEELEQMIRRKEFARRAVALRARTDGVLQRGRPSVREALAALKRKGLVQINNGELPAFPCRLPIPSSANFGHGERFSDPARRHCPFRAATPVL